MEFNTDYVGSGVLTIDLAALRRNYELLRKHSAPAETAAVVKADAYGIGARFVAPALYDVGCRLFFVAHLVEAFRLKTFLPTDAKIAILNGIPEKKKEETAGAGFIPVLNSFSSLCTWVSFCCQRKKKFQGIIQLDSGMSRLGFSVEEIEQLIANPAIFEQADILCIMSHLACSDEYTCSMNIEQLAYFRRVIAKLPKMPASFSSSGGICLGKEYMFDLVRPGIALYGVNPCQERKLPLCPVVGLQAYILQIRHLPKGIKVGYGGTWRAPHSTRVATLGVGYADGWHRRLSNCGSVFFKEQKIPVIGRISMDSMTVDITALPTNKTPKAGDLVELIGPSQSLESVARDAETIPYEILTSLGQRYDRRVFNNSFFQNKTCGSYCS